MGLIYKVTNIVNNKIYIGQTVRRLNERISSHIKESNCDKTYFHRALKKYGKDNFTWDILEDNIDNIDELNRLEEYYISLYNSNNRKYGYNSTPGGYNYIPNKEVCERISKKLTGIKRTQEFKDKISKKLMGHSLSKESRKKISEKSKGKIITQKQRNIISKTHKGKILPKEHIEAIRNAHLNTHHSESSKEKIRQAILGSKQSGKTIAKKAQKTKEYYLKRYNDWKNNHYNYIKENIIKYKDELLMGLISINSLFNKNIHQSSVYFMRAFKEIWEEVFNEKYISIYSKHKSKEMVGVK